jgi:hypothetical protein
MSDPVSNVEIEDVLSSIRRLVSEDARSTPARAAAQPERLVLTPALRVSDDQAEPADEKAAEAADGPLVLGDADGQSWAERLAAMATPAEPSADVSTVEDTTDIEAFDDAEEAELSEVALPEVTQEEPEQAEALFLSEALKAPQGDAVTPRDAALELDDSAGPASSEIDDILAELSATTEQSDDTVHSAEDAAEQEPDDATAPKAAKLTAQSILSQLVEEEVSRALRDDFDDTLDDDIGQVAGGDAHLTWDKMDAVGEDLDAVKPEAPATVEPVLARRAAHLSLVSTRGQNAADEADHPVQAEEPSEPVDAAELSEAASALDDPRDAFQHTDEATEIEDAVVLDVTGQAAEENRPESSDSDTLEQKITQLESLVGAREEDWGADEPASSAAVFHRSSAIDWQDAHEDDPETEQAEPLEPPVTKPDPTPTQPLTLDDAALREMVTEVIREELKGVLGERITRNVRKLVRREIHRVITSQELD